MAAYILPYSHREWDQGEVWAREGRTVPPSTLPSPPLIDDLSCPALYSQDHCGLNVMNLRVNLRIRNFCIYEIVNLIWHYLSCSHIKICMWGKPVSAISQYTCNTHLDQIYHLWSNNVTFFHFDVKYSCNYIMYVYLDVFDRFLGLLVSRFT